MALTSCRFTSSSFMTRFYSEIDKIVMTDTLNTLINSRQELQEFLDNAKENNQTVLLEDDKIRELLGLRIPDEHHNWLNEK